MSVSLHRCAVDENAFAGRVSRFHAEAHHCLVAHISWEAGERLYLAVSVSQESLMSREQ